MTPASINTQFIETAAKHCPNWKINQLTDLIEVWEDGKVSTVFYMPTHPKFYDHRNAESFVALIESTLLAWDKEHNEHHGWTIDSPYSGEDSWVYTCYGEKHFRIEGNTRVEAAMAALVLCYLEPSV